MSALQHKSISSSFCINHSSSESSFERKFIAIYLNVPALHVFISCHIKIATKTLTKGNNVKVKDAIKSAHNGISFATLLPTFSSFFKISVDLKTASSIHIGSRRGLHAESFCMRSLIKWNKFIFSQIFLNRKPSRHFASLHFCV